jgi:hypothetical protein
MTATIQLESKPRSRRALLAGALGGLGALVASAVGHAGPVRAGVDGDVVLGAPNSATTTTKIQNTANNEAVLWGASTSGVAVYGSSSSGVGVNGTSASNAGVQGSSDSYYGAYGYSTSHVGVWGENFASDQPASLGFSGNNWTGVQGYSGVGSPPPAKAKTGVFGYAAQDSNSRGVVGESPAGRGIHGVATTGYAGYFSGKVYTTKWYELTEISTPPNPIANRARLFIKDNGLGKTQVCVKFANGTVKVLATES